MLVETPQCPYCAAASELVKGDVIYPHRPDLAHKPFFRCEPCKAWVGCHDGTHRALGRLADAELRRWKERAHAAFDPLWAKKKVRDKCSTRVARGAGYAWLADQLGISGEECQIGMFDVATCRRVVEICQSLKGPR